jgi:hypothetical protein
MHDPFRLIITKKNGLLCKIMSQRPLRSRQPVLGDCGAERISLVISAADRAFLDRIANEKRVSLAWMIRDAVTRYFALLENQEPTEKSNG